MVQQLRLHVPVWGDLGLIPSQGTKSHMLQLRSHAIMKMEDPVCSQINILKILLKNKTNYVPQGGPSPQVHTLCSVLLLFSGCGGLFFCTLLNL